MRMRIMAMMMIIMRVEMIMKMMIYAGNEFMMTTLLILQPHVISIRQSNS